MIGRRGQQKLDIVIQALQFYNLRVIQVMNIQRDRVVSILRGYSTAILIFKDDFVFTVELFIRKECYKIEDFIYELFPGVKTMKTILSIIALVFAGTAYCFYYANTETQKELARIQFEKQIISIRSIMN